jgi:integrase
VRNNGGNINLRRAPVLRDFALRFLDFVDAQTASGHLDPDTKLYYHGGWKMLEGTKLAGMRIDQIGTSDAAILQFPRSPSNANRAFRTLSRMLRLATEWRVMRAAPRIKLLEEHGRKSLIESSTEALLLEHASQPLRDILVIMMDSGMRPEEVMRMRKEHIAWERSVILVPYGKTSRSERFVPLSDRMGAVLGLRKDGACPWLFPSHRAVSGHLTTVAKQWRETVKLASICAIQRKLPPISPTLKLYCARHTFATDMLREGLNLAEVRDLMGHEDVKTTMKYLHPDTSGSAAIVNHRNRSNSLHLLKEAS